MARAHKFADKHPAGPDADTTTGPVVDLSSAASVMVWNSEKADRQAPANRLTSTAATLLVPNRHRSNFSRCGWSPHEVPPYWNYTISPNR